MSGFVFGVMMRTPSAMDGPRPAVRAIPFEVFGVPRRPEVPVYSRPEGKRIGSLSEPDYFQLQGQSRQWLRGRSEYVESQNGMWVRRERWVRLQDIAVEPDVIRREVIDVQRDLGDPGGEGPPAIQVLDANGKGQLVVWWQYTIDRIIGPNDHVAYVYTTRDGVPVPLIHHRELLQALRLPDGTHAFASLRLLWQGKAYQWREGTYQLLPLPRNGWRWRVLRENMPALWFSLFAIPPALWLLIFAWTRRHHYIAPALLTPYWIAQTRRYLLCCAATAILIVALTLLYGYHFLWMVFLGLTAPVGAAASLVLLMRVMVWTRAMSGSQSS
ncbi:MAG: hypothetical protein RMK49_12045 [Abditibacteriales bacterium]|nr:hypothetical protein [Abditibacteriales bacterium]